MKFFNLFTKSVAVLFIAIVAIAIIVIAFGGFAIGGWATMHWNLSYDGGFWVVLGGTIAQIAAWVLIALGIGLAAHLSDCRRRSGPGGGAPQKPPPKRGVCFF